MPFSSGISSDRSTSTVSHSWNCSSGKEFVPRPDGERHMSEVVKERAKPNDLSPWDERLSLSGKTLTAGCRLFSCVMTSNTGAHPLHQRCSNWRCVRQGRRDR